MSQQIQLTQEEFSELKLLQGKFQEMIMKFGTLQVDKLNLDQAVAAFIEKEKALKEEWLSLQKLEDGLSERIVTKYGEGNLNMTNGTFIQSAPPPK